MNKDQAQGKMDRFSAKIKQTWGDLTDDEVKKAEGNKDELIARIREKYGDSKEAIAEKLNALMED
ncbi:MAG: CsbD family protein [Wenzhouxiangella sp.]